MTMSLVETYTEEYVTRFKQIPLVYLHLNDPISNICRNNSSWGDFSEKIKCTNGRYKF